MSLIFDLLLMGAVNMLSPSKKPKTDREKYYEQFHKKETSMECLAFDTMSKKEETQVKFTEPTDDVYRDIDDDEGPDW